MAIETRPLHPHVGAEMTGIDVRKPLTPAEVAAVDAGMDKHAVLVLPRQDITDEQQIEFTRNFGPLQNGANATLRPLIQTAMPGYLCPSDAAGRVARSRPDAARSVGGTNFGRSNYVATMHDASWNNNVFSSKAHNGIVTVNSKPATAMKDITDGTSKTLVVGERVDAVPGGRDTFSGDPSRPWNPSSGTWAGTNISGYANPDLYGNNGECCTARGAVFNGGSSFYGINNFSTVDSHKGFSSVHGGGAMFVMADSAVQFLREDIDATTFNRLVNPKDGRVIDAY